MALLSEGFPPARTFHAGAGIQESHPCCACLRGTSKLDYQFAWPQSKRWLSLILGCLAVRSCWPKGKSPAPLSVFHKEKSLEKYRI